MYRWIGRWGIITINDVSIIIWPYRLWCHLGATLIFTFVIILLVELVKMDVSSQGSTSIFASEKLELYFPTSLVFFITVMLDVELSPSLLLLYWWILVRMDTSSSYEFSLPIVGWRDRWVGRMLNNLSIILWVYKSWC